MPSIDGRVIKNTFKFLLDKVYSTLASWKAKVLSMAGRIILSMSVTTAIPGYAMQIAKLSKTIYDSIDRCNRSLDTKQRKHLHLVN